MKIIHLLLKNLDQSASPMVALWIGRSEIISWGQLKLRVGNVCDRHNISSKEAVMPAGSRLLR